MRFIHIADLHLGSSPEAEFLWGKNRAEEIWDSFAAVIDACNEKEIDLLLIAGDLFDRPPVWADLDRAAKLFDRLTATEVVMIAGESEYITEDSPWMTYPWEPWVHMLSDKHCMNVQLGNISTSVHGCSYYGPTEGKPYLEDARPDKESEYQILLGYTGDDNHMPADLTELSEKGFDYIALGHIHRPEMIEPNRMAYAGALEPIDSNDTGEHGFWVGEITKAFGQVQFCPLRKCQYVHETIQLSSQMTNMAVQTIVKNLLANRKPYELYKIFLTGTLNADTELDLDWIRNQEAVVDVICSLRQDYDYDRLREENEQQLLGRFIAAMQSRGESEVYKKALEFGVEALLSAKFDR